MRRLLFYTILIIISLSSCETEENVPFIDESAALYAENFIKEGAIRGIDIDLDELGIEIYVENIEEGNVYGFCNHNGDKPGFVVIDKPNWDRLSDLDKEFLLFHELGHCVLGRQHLDTRNIDDTCISMMHSTEDACLNIYSSLTRTSYLDELFDE